MTSVCNAQLPDKKEANNFYHKNSIGTGILIPYDFVYDSKKIDRSLIFLEYNYYLKNRKNIFSIGITNHSRLSSFSFTTLPKDVTGKQGSIYSGFNFNLKIFKNLFFISGIEAEYNFFTFSSAGKTNRYFNFGAGPNLGLNLNLSPSFNLGSYSSLCFGPSYKHETFKINTGQISTPSNGYQIIQFYKLKFLSIELHYKF